MEQLLHYVWRHKIFPLQELMTTSGLPVEVIDPGLPNTNAGPDFFNAKLKIDGTLWVGNVEIHAVSSDWYRHGHDKDKAYDSVILHVAGETDCEVHRCNGETLPQLQLSCPDSVCMHYEELRQADKYPPCYTILSSLPKLTIHSWLTALQTERFEQKTEVISERLKRTNNHWEDTFFITLSRNFGFGLNGDAFEAWANLMAFRAVDKHRDDLFQVEAFFFGQAGLLQETLEEDAYYRKMQKEYLYLKHKFDLSEMDPSLWRFLRLRPGNFPHVRIAQLAYLYHQSRGLLSQIVEAETLAEVKSVLATRTSAYWEEHYIFGKPSPHRVKNLGDGSLHLLIINTVVPFLYAYGLHKSDEVLCLRAGNYLEELNAENNYVTRLWEGVGLPVHSAADSQALLQLRKEYCDKKNCLRCRFGYEYLKHK
ncbi:DUF2851 family protein [uncultured Bacteroides sp.]|uniref:DUF2851 family protein n=1 Tax=uncultured Bacteroides sp. TaxID=162156 RepID=UPI002AA8F596|nr:DUF2851 family protein [uncultured Bacteroides sp.]